MMIREIPPEHARFIRWLASRLVRRLSWRVERDDLEQEGYLAVWDFIRSGRRASPQYTRVVARNAMLMLGRRARRWDHERCVEGAGENDIDESTADAASALDAREALGKLSPTEREALTAVPGGSRSDLAAKLGITERAAAIRMWKAGKKLRAALGESYASPRARSQEN